MRVLSLIHIFIVSHGILCDFLREELALPEERANEVACQIEHIMTFEEIEKLKMCIRDRHSGALRD